MTKRPRPTPPEGGGTPGVRPLQHSEESLRHNTGRTSEEWFALLDAWGASSRTHAEIARWLGEEHQVPGWWAQGVTVAYEQARGMRAPGQRSDGTFSATASKIIDAPAERAFAAFADPELRERWLGDLRLAVRRESPPRNFRADVLDDDSRLVVSIAAKDDDRSQVAVEQERLSGSEASAHSKARWRERLTALKELLEGG